MTQRHGFTLLEVSIVILIIGLIVAGIATTSALVDTAKLQSVIAEQTNYRQAINEFRDKYQAMPGDMSNATSVWGTSGTAGHCTGATAMTSLPTTQATCNGDGNEMVGTSTAAGVITNANLEWWLVWQHLANARLINGRYTGGNFVAGNASSDRMGFNLPTSKYNPGTWKLFYYRKTDNDTSMWQDDYGHVLMFGNGQSTTSHTAPILTPADAREIDNKVDDGLPGGGTIRAFRSSVLTNCTTSDTSAANARYNVSNQNVLCTLMFMIK
ncbi:MAG: prepilin-type N-terminal cleavage/methylation domain-containing protein [Rickettsiales bacterium]|nr:prepilin-type N-terminal cleavage/methylation domain-containing protein [Rickettsiales bacterium]